MAKLLVSYGADIHEIQDGSNVINNCASSWNWVFLDFDIISESITLEYPELLKWYIDQNVDMYVRNRWGLFPIHLLGTENVLEHSKKIWLDIFNVLIDAGCNINVVTHDNETLLDLLNNVYYFWNDGTTGKEYVPFVQWQIDHVIRRGGKIYKELYYESQYKKDKKNEEFHGNCQ